MKNIIAIQIGEDIKTEFKKLQETFDKDCCPACNRPYPNPYTQLWLADQIGVSKATLCHILQGNRLPSIEQLIKLSIVLNCRIDDLCLSAKFSLLACK